MLSHAGFRLSAVLILGVSVLAQTNPISSSVPSPSPEKVTSAQPSAVKLVVKAMVVDRDLDVKPIPKFVLSLQRTDGEGETIVSTLTTRVDGTLDTQVATGRYRIASVKPLNFEASIRLGSPLQAHLAPVQTLILHRLEQVRSVGR